MPPILGGSSGYVLTVCTGNVCRSPYLERRLAQLLAGTGLRVASAGLGALVGEPMDPSSAAVLARDGGSAKDFCAQQVTPDLIALADLVLAATRSHRAQVVRLHPPAMNYCFTPGDLADLADLLTGLDPKDLGRPAPETNWVAHVVRAAASRRGLVPPCSREESDIVDPYGGESAVFEYMAAQIERALPGIAGVLRPPQ